MDKSGELKLALGSQEVLTFLTMMANANLGIESLVTSEAGPYLSVLAE